MDKVRRILGLDVRSPTGSTTPNAGRRVKASYRFGILTSTPGFKKRRIPGVHPNLV